jgi:O-antigen ligase/polysaccharide polymerase Wzy-like membrane protein/PDZ domain-containing protein
LAAFLPVQRSAAIGFFLYAAAAPHSIAAAEISLALVGSAWLVRTLGTRQTGFSHTRIDLPVWLLFLWTIASAAFSAEPRVSLLKLQSVCVFLLFYLTQAVVTRRIAVLLVATTILSGLAGTLYSSFDLLRGRGVVVETLAPGSPFRAAGIEPGDAVWRIGQQRVYSVGELDEAIRNARPGSRLAVSVISQGEHVEWPGFVVTAEIQRVPSPSGITGERRAHRFRASGWTRHYETFSEILQLLVQLSLGLALANFQNHGLNRRFKFATISALVLAVGVGLTAMRTSLVALAIGAAVVVGRAARGATRIFVVTAIIAILLFGAAVVYRTRATNALWLEDPSSSLRWRVAQVGLSRILLHPVFGHGMDAMQLHWSEWGFPGNDMIHLHSTPLQLAFDRGLPALAFWLWAMGACWLLVTRAERRARDSSDTNAHGVLLGTTGAVAGFFASSLVNYNFGDGEVVLLFWWLMGIAVVLAARPSSEEEKVRHGPFDVR